MLEKMPWRKFKANQEKFCFCDLATLTKDTDYFLNLIHQVLKIFMDEVENSPCQGILFHYILQNYKETLFNTEINRRNNTQI